MSRAATRRRPAKTIPHRATRKDDVFPITGLDGTVIHALPIKGPGTEIMIAGRY